AGLVAALDAALQRVRHSGEQDELYVKWIGNLGAVSRGRADPPWLWWLLPLAATGGFGAWWLGTRRRPAASNATGNPAAAPSQVDVEALDLLTELRQAIVDGTLGFALQPKLDLRTRRWCGAELLVRWDHP